MVRIKSDKLVANIDVGRSVRRLGISHFRVDWPTGTAGSAYAASHGRWFRYDDDGRLDLFWRRGRRHQVLRRRTRWRQGGHRVCRPEEGRPDPPRGGGRILGRPVREQYGHRTTGLRGCGRRDRQRVGAGAHRPDAPQPGSVAVEPPPDGPLSTSSLSAATRGNPRVALVTCRELPDLDPDDRLLIGPLAARGVAVEAVAWD